MGSQPKKPPPYAIASVDNALRIATMLQVEGPFTVSDVAERLGVARSTAHRLLAMLVYRDFAVQDDGKVYHAGPILELAVHSHSSAARLRAAALPHLRRLVDHHNESANLTVRAGTTARFIATVECGQSLRVGNREGMVFPAHRTTGGLLLLANVPDDELVSLYGPARFVDYPAERPDLDELLRAELRKVRRNGFAVNQGRSERGVVAVGVAVRDPDQQPVAGISLSMPSIRYDRHQLRLLVASLSTAAHRIENDLTGDRT